MRNQRADFNRMKTASVEARIKTFLARYSPDIRAEFQSARTHLRSLFPRGHELVYDNYNALVFAFSPNESSSNAFVSVAGYPRWVTLFFLNGVDLKDPKGLLEGEGSQVRSIRLKSAQHLSERAVHALIVQAIKPHRKSLLAAAPLLTTIKAVVAKQRPRRPGKSKAT
jgi:hypothetical protein